jgi:hypothetical protein
MNGRVNEKYRQGAKANFVILCLDALQRGYERMVSDGQYDVDCKEDKLTAHLVEKIKLTGFLASKQISVNHQPPIYSEGVIYGDEDPLEAPRVDFKFTKWYKKLELDYYAEAKNLSESDWQKKDGSKVSASKYRARYIDTGIDNFLSGRYPEGCLLGYIVQGKKQNVIAGINRLIQSRKILPKVGLIQKDRDVPYSTCHCSSHDFEGRQFTIRHVFMQFWSEG